MEEDQEQKHLCKFCKKSFPCGRSLGGHMRSHMTINSAEAEENLNKRKVSSVNGGSNSNSYMGFEASGHSGYGLRENPKKTWRSSDSGDGALLQGKVCKECGKEFQSWKALFGHMRCHSERDMVSNSLEDEDSWSGENQKLVMDSQSDNEAAAPRRRRSIRGRLRTTNSCSSFANASSSVSETEHEQEEVAMCLMMLSRDVVGYRGGLNLVAEYSDNISVLSSGSGYFMDGLNKVELEVSVDGFTRDDEFKMPKPNKETRFEVFDMDSSKKNRPSSKKCNVNELGKSLIKESGFNHDESEFGKRSNGYDPEMGGMSYKKVKYDASVSEIFKEAKKKGKYECTTCNKIFRSYQALGGHRASHKKIKGCFASRIENSENSFETEVSSDPIPESNLIKSFNNKNPINRNKAPSVETSNGSKKSKGHECPICFKVFLSGQALGGHKRSHLIGGSDARSNQTIVIHKEVPETSDLLDLNLPAPVEEDTRADVEFKPWWIESNHKHKQLVGL